MAAGDILQAVVVQTLHGQTLLNRFLFVTDTGPGDMPSFLTSFTTLATQLFVPNSSNQWTLNRIDAQKISPRPLTYTLSESLNLPGTQSGTPLPTEVSYVVSKNTQYAGRKYRGRWYIGGQTIEVTDQSTLLPGVQLSLQNAWDKAALPLQTATNEIWYPVLSHGYVPNTDVISYDKINQVIVRSILRSQRRRQVGRGI